MYHWSVTKVFHHESSQDLIDTTLSNMPSWSIRLMDTKLSNISHSFLKIMSSENLFCFCLIIVFLSHPTSLSALRIFMVVKIQHQESTQLKNVFKKCLCNHKWMGKTQVLKNIQPRKKTLILEKHWTYKKHLKKIK